MCREEEGGKEQGRKTPSSNYQERKGNSSKGKEGKGARSSLPQLPGRERVGRGTSTTLCPIEEDRRGEKSTPYAGGRSGGRGKSQGLLLLIHLEREGNVLSPILKRKGRGGNVIERKSSLTPRRKGRRSGKKKVASHIHIPD